MFLRLWVRDPTMRIGSRGPLGAPMELPGLERPNVYFRSSGKAGQPAASAARGRVAPHRSAMSKDAAETRGISRAARRIRAAPPPGPHRRFAALTRPPAAATLSHGGEGFAAA